MAPKRQNDSDTKGGDGCGVPSSEKHTKRVASKKPPAMSADDQRICGLIKAQFPHFDTYETAEWFRCTVHHDVDFVMSCLCRDELSVDRADHADNGGRHVFTCPDHPEHRGAEPFEFGSLGGLCNVGETGYLAATHHVPEKAGAKVVLVGGPHIGHVIDAKTGADAWGLVFRDDIEAPGHACGAVAVAIQALQKRVEAMPPTPSPSVPFSQTVKTLLSAAHEGKAPNPAPKLPENAALPAFNDYEQNDLVRSVEQQFLAAAMLGATGMTEFRAAVQQPKPSSQLMVDVTNCVRAASEQRLEYVAGRVQKELAANGHGKYQRTLRVVDCLVVHWSERTLAPVTAAAAGAGKGPATEWKVTTRTFVASKSREFKKQEAKDGGKAAASASASAATSKL